MKFGIVGNNDGPLYLLKAIAGSNFNPEFVGLQKEVPDDLQEDFLNYIDPSSFFCSFNEDKLSKKIQDFDIDLLINCFCNFKFTSILENSYDVLNIHLSLLPEYRGRHPLHWVLINGETKSGYTIHNMTANIDAGNILWQSETNIEEGMSVQELRSNILNKLKNEFLAFLNAYQKGRLTPIENKNDHATYAPRRYPEDSKLIHWHDSNLIYRKIRAMRSEENPAFFTSNNIKFICLDVQKADAKYEDILQPFIAEKKENTILVVCSDGNTLWIKIDKNTIPKLILNQKIDCSIK